MAPHDRRPIVDHELWMSMSETEEIDAAPRHGRKHSAPLSRASIAAMVAIGLLAVAGASWAAWATFATPRPGPAIQGRGTTTPTVPATSALDATVSAPATPNVEATPSGPATITVSAVGDMQFDRGVGALIDAKGGAAPLTAVASILASADVTLGNLESPLSTRGSEASKTVTFRGSPKAIAGLTAAGFDLVSLANNHVLDYGRLALADTISRLDAAGIAHAGAGPNRAAAFKAAIVERGGARVAFLSFSDIIPPDFAAGVDRPGLASGRDLDAIRRAIRDARARADYVLVSFHWGIEYVDDANATQIARAHAAIDAGADMVLSEHTHVIQAVERYRGRLIAYSLGDFVFDHYSRKTGESFIITAELGASGVGKVGIVPVYLTLNGGAPQVVTGSEAVSILSRLKRISAKRGTTVVVTGSRATVASR